MYILCMPTFENHLSKKDIIFSLGLKSRLYRIELVHSLSGERTIEYLRERVFQTGRN